MIRIGVSGWTYSPWRGHFYPAGLPQHAELRYAAAHFPTIEVNGTFYRLQRPATFRRWAAQAPRDFLFAVKGPRYITHLTRLVDPVTPLANFFASGVLELGLRLGPILWQFPERFAFDPERLEPFLALLPHESGAALDLARRHDGRAGDVALPEAIAPFPLRHAVEIRHESFRTSAFTDLLRRHGVALVCADTVKWPRLMDLTADFAYLRLHGSEELYRSSYDDAALDRWAALASAFAAGTPPPDDVADFIDKPAKDRRPRDVFIYFDNTDKRHAPENALTLMAKLGLR